MEKKHRLFLFAGYDKDSIIDNTVVYYINALSKLGDVVFFADNDLSNTEIKKISKISNVLYAGAMRHGEYDFGSYKRAYLWAKKNRDIKKYDWVYLANDSVYGPLNDLKPILEKLENSGADLIGMSANCDRYTPLHVQSWFVGLKPEIVSSKFFDEFMTNIKQIPNKMHLVLKYEVGLSAMILRHGFKMKVILNADENNLYGAPRQALIAGVPFIKKNAIANVHNMCFLYPHLDDEILLDYIQEHMQRHNIKLAHSSYNNIYELRLFAIPLIRIMAKDSKYYKVYLFGRIPVLKIIK